jgi:hypothetical protein
MYQLCASPVPSDESDGDGKHDRLATITIGRRTRDERPKDGAGQGRGDGKAQGRFGQRELGLQRAGRAGNHSGIEAEEKTAKRGARRAHHDRRRRPGIIDDADIVGAYHVMH